MSSRSAIKTSFILAPCFMILIKAASFFKVSYIIGSYTALFSASSFMPGVVGVYGGLAGSGLVLALGLVMRSYFGLLSFKILAYHIPSFFAAASWANSHWSIRVFVPAICMVLFVVHPVGFYAAPYALYWLIPIYLHYSVSKNLFSTALASTFIAHAVGSVIWLYTVPMTTAAWLALIPIVLLERLLIAAGMVGVHQVAKAWVRHVQWIKAYAAARTEQQ